MLAFGDGWFSQRGGLTGIDELSRRAAALRRRAADSGRGPIPITVFNSPPDKRPLDALLGAGVDRCLLLLPAGTESELLTTLDEWAPLAS